MLSSSNARVLEVGMHARYKASNQGQLTSLHSSSRRAMNCFLPQQQMK